MKKKVKDNGLPPWEDSVDDSQEVTAEAADLTTKKGARGNREVAPVVPAVEEKAKRRSKGEAAPAAEEKETIEEAPRRNKRDGSAESSRANKAARDSEAGDEPGTTTKARRSATMVGYRWVMKNIMFFLFLAGLAVVYIYNGHYADKISRDISRTNKELKELQYEYKTLRSEVMFRSKQSELARAVEPFGLKELTRPPFVLVDSVKK